MKHNYLDSSMVDRPRIPRVGFIPRAKVLEPHRIEVMKASKEVRISARGKSMNRHHAAAEFEKRFTEYIGTKESIALDSGSSAFALALLLSDVKEGDEVIFSAWNAPLIADIIKLIGAIPIAADCLAGSLTIDPAIVKKLITSKTKAIIATHVDGFPCRLRELRKICSSKGRKIALIEDCAHSLGATYRGKMTGSIGDYSLFSFGQLKQLNCHGGGMLCANTLDGAEKIKELKACLQTPNNNSILRKEYKALAIRAFTSWPLFDLAVFPALFISNYFSPDILYSSFEGRWHKLPMPRRLSEKQSILGIAGLKNYNHLLHKRRYAYSVLKMKLNTKKGIRINNPEEGTHEAPLNAVIILPDHISQRMVRRELLKKGIDMQRSWMRWCGKRDEGRLAKRLDKKAMNISMGLEEWEIRTICRCINKILVEHSDPNNIERLSQ